MWIKGLDKGCGWKGISGRGMRRCTSLCIIGLREQDSWLR